MVKGAGSDDVVGVTKIKSFEDLNVWKACRELRRNLFDLTSAFPNEERFRLADQIRRAAISVTSNIAEGYGRYHYQENIQFCRQSRGSLYEVLDHLTTAVDLGYVSDGELQKYRSAIVDAVKLINGYIRMLGQRKRAEV
jgi:four helix bundle protein